MSLLFYLIWIWDLWSKGLLIAKLMLKNLITPFNSRNISQDLIIMIPSFSVVEIIICTTINRRSKINIRISGPSTKTRNKIKERRKLRQRKKLFICDLLLEILSLTKMQIQAAWIKSTVLTIIIQKSQILLMISSTIDHPLLSISI